MAHVSSLPGWCARLHVLDLDCLQDPQGLLERGGPSLAFFWKAFDPGRSKGQVAPGRIVPWLAPAPNVPLEAFFMFFFKRGLRGAP